MKVQIRVRCRARVLTPLLFAGALSWTTPLDAQDPDTLAVQPTGREHVVRRGDTLWDLAAFYLSDPFLWPDIYEANRDVVDDPHWIYPAERLIIPPFARRVAADAVAVTPAEIEMAARRTRFYAGPPAVVPGGVVGGTPTVLSDEDEPSPVVFAGEFYATPWLDDPDELPVVAELVQPLDTGPIRVERADAWVHPYDQIFLRYGPGPRPAVGDRLLLVRVGRRVDDMGRIIEPTGIATVAALHEDVMTAVMTEQFTVSTSGDLAVPLGPAPASTIGPQPVDAGPEGVLIDFRTDQPLYGTTDHAFVDLGRTEGLESGDELVAYLPSRPAKEPFGDLSVPPEPVARLKVVRVQEETATVRVLGARHGALRPGLPVRLVRKMP